MTAHFLFLGLGEAAGFGSILRLMAMAGVQPPSSWAQSDSNQLTTASNWAAVYHRAAVYLRGYIVCVLVQLCIV
jgi:hypothetical protein